MVVVAAAGVGLDYSIWSTLFHENVGIKNTHNSFDAAVTVRVDGVDG